MIIFSRCAYRSVFSVCSQELEPGEMVAIMDVRERLPMSDALSTLVSTVVLKGTWLLPLSNALMHSLRANRDLLISAPSDRVWLLTITPRSAPNSDPARSMSANWPKVAPDDGTRSVICRMAWLRDDWSFA